MNEKPEVKIDDDADDLLPEYDFSNAKPNRFAARFEDGAEQRIVVLDTDVATVFTTSSEVNEVLRALIATMPHPVAQA